jgi:hypothetical protein
MGEMKNAYKIFIRSPERKSPLVKPRGGWENIYLKERGCDFQTYHLAQ